jgi:putative DNA modification/repair radical SAM protein
MYINQDHALSIEDKIAQMQEDARYDVADPLLTYGSEQPEQEVIPDLSMFADIHSKQTPPKVPKVFLSNQCSFNCAYCGCRASRDGNSRYCNTPREMAEISLKTAKNNGHGVFITSAIYKNANYTEEMIIETLRILRKELFYDGYIHAKVMPGTDPSLIAKAGQYANRLSVNIEVARNAGYERIAKQKNKENILVPMQQISELVRSARNYKSYNGPIKARSQTTQLMAGSTEESDRTIMTLSGALYKKYGLSRVYYTAFHYEDPAKGYDIPFSNTPLWRVRRLYQADRLMQLYGFTSDEVTPEADPNLTEGLDPKINWALRNIHLFPIEVNTADYEQLLRIPGIGLTYAQKIIRARRYGTVTHQTLRRIGVVLKKSSYFLTCNGKYEGSNLIEHPDLLKQIFTEDIPTQNSSINSQGNLLSQC